jgi:hypothetical protein
MNFDAFTADILKKKYDMDSRFRTQHWTGPQGAQAHNVVFLNIQKRIIYLHTHKNASTFVRQFFQPLISGHSEDVPGAPWNKEGCLQADFHHIPQTKEWKNFWIVRNPIDRIISAFLRGKHKAWITVAGKRDEFIVIGGERFPRPHRYALPNEFDVFLKRVKMSYFDPHLYPQVVTFADKGLDLADVDDIILFDNLTKELQDYSDKHRLGWKVASQSPKNEQPSHEKQELQDYVRNDRRIRAKIEALYPEDFLIYNYIKELRSGT